MKTLYALLMALLVSGVLHAQNENPVSWSFSAEKTSNKIYTVRITAAIQPGWHIYAQQQPKDAIAQPTVIKPARNPLIQIGTEWKEQGTKETQQLKELGITQYYYAGKVDFTQAIKLIVDVKTDFSGRITYMACDSKICLPVTSIQFSIKLQ